jgi:hypothetical protein
MRSWYLLMMLYVPIFGNPVIVEPNFCRYADIYLTAMSSYGE